MSNRHSRQITTSSFGRLSPAIDEKTGIVSRIDVLRNTALDPDLFCAVAQDAKLAPIIGYGFDNRGAAAALTLTRAAVRAAGECIERYCSAFYEPAELYESTISDLESSSKQFLATQSFYSFDIEQYKRADFPFKSLSAQSKIKWVNAHDFHSGEDVLVPASCVYLPYLFQGEPITHAPISTGLAAGTSISDCIEKGLAEIIERDTLMINWKTQRKVPSIQIETVLGRSEEIDRLMLSTSRLPGRWFLHLLTLDIEVPVMSATFMNHSGPPLTSFGISANRDVMTALRGALEEALLSRFLLNRSPEVVNDNDSSTLAFRTLREHLFGHATSQSLKRSFFKIFDPVPTMPFDAVCSRFHTTQTAVEATRRAGLRVLYRDVTSSDVASLGINSVRVLVPTSEPLDPDHQSQHLGGSRLRRAANGKVLNPDPHPFP